jgi:hypothetical protein
MADAAYQAKYLGIARLLWQASEGDPSRIPSTYSEYLNHTYIDGDISLAGLLPFVEEYSELEEIEIEEAIEMLGKVNPNDWPDIEHIEGVSAERLLRVNDEDTSEFDFVEDNLSTSEHVEKVLTEVISSVFGDKVSTIRSEKGYYANPKNKFLQDKDGTFAGTFMYAGKKFIFEITPAENGWVCTYRMHWGDIDKLPPLSQEESEGKKDYTRHIRHRGWK